MDEPLLSPHPPQEPPENKSRDRQNLIAQIVLGSVCALALVVVVSQYVTSKKLSAGNNEASTGATPANLKSADPVTQSEPEVLVAPESANSQNVRERAEKIAERLATDTTALIGIAAELSERLELAEEELKGTRALYTSTARKVLLLEREAATAGRKAAEAEILSAQLAESRALLDVSKRRSEALLQKLASSPDPKMLRDAQAMRDLYEAELTETKARLARDEAEKARLRADLNAANSELAATATALESTELFIDSIDLLPEAAKQLFLELSRLETVDSAELAKNYQLIEQKLGAKVVDKIRFATGSSELSSAKAATIGTAMSEGRSDSFFLVIGYASKTGSFDFNKALSSARATAVATQAVASSQPGQKVRAVFLGQTDRFSSSDVLDDQVCELWEIRKQVPATGQ